MISYEKIRAMEQNIKACKEADSKPMAARWYAEDVELLLAEIERLRDERNKALWRAA